MLARRLERATVGLAEREERISALQAEVKGYAEAIAAGELDVELGVHLREQVDRTKGVGLVQRARDAYYARDLAMNALALVVYSKEAQLVDPVLDVYMKWERRQVELMQSDHDHGLSRDHPRADGSGARYWRGRPPVQR